MTTSENLPAQAPNGLTAPNSVAAPVRGLPNLAAALVAARAKVQPVPETAENTFHRYKYAAADAIIREARKALDASGVALVPVEQSIDGWQREGPERFELVRKMVLIHSSGECLPVWLRWPVCPDKGRPLDKAAAAADTLSLAYFLRDLLLMDRVDPADDVAGRDDRPARAAAAPAVADP